MYQPKGRSLSQLICTLGLAISSSQAIASAFQIWEQDGASVGNFHAGYAAIAEDASTAFYNPAGISRFSNQQIVFAGSAVTPSIKYRGTVATTGLNNEAFTVTAQGGNFAFIPALHFVTPISDILGFGFSVTAPFGMKLNYGYNSNIRYAVTRTSAEVIDISPVISIKLTDKASVGFGPDIQLMRAGFDLVGAVGPDTDTDGINNASGTGYGFHLGGLYEFTPNTRIGLSYHSQVVHHLTGKSTFSGLLADPDLNSDSNTLVSTRSKVNITLPAYTALSIFHQTPTKFAFMGSVIYTQWSILRELALQNVAGLDRELLLSKNILVIIPEYFRNTWSISLGANYYPSEQVILRTGVGFDQTPVSSTYRNAGLPDNNRYIFALGGHYQATKVVGLDLSWAHIFINKAHVIPPTQIAGGQETTTNGSVTGGADVFSAQLTWNIA